MQLGDFLAFVEKQANTSRTNNVILTMGGDFTYMDAEIYYDNLDRLIRWAKLICGHNDNDDDDDCRWWCTHSKYLIKWNQSFKAFHFVCFNQFSFATFSHWFWFRVSVFHVISVQTVKLPMALMQISPHKKESNLWLFLFLFPFLLTQVNMLLTYFALVELKYRSNNILITFGDDFHYQDANSWFNNIDKLILWVGSSIILLLRVLNDCVLYKNSNLLWKTPIRLMAMCVNWIWIFENPQMVFVTPKCDLGLQFIYLAQTNAFAKANTVYLFYNLCLSHTRKWDIAHFEHHNSSFIGHMPHIYLQLMIFVSSIPNFKYFVQHSSPF